jgi:serine/threonine-protein kinase RsbW
MKNSSDNSKSDPIIRAMTEDDAEGLSRCVTACYGDSYPGRDFYDPEKIRSFFRQGLMYSQIAVTREGEVIGHLGIMLEHTGDITADAIAGFVAPAYRGSDTMFRLGLNLVVTQQELHLVGIQVYALMLHNITYKKTLSIGGTEAGMLPAHFPPSTSPKGFEHTDDKSRIPAALMYVPLQPAPERIVFVPERYHDTIGYLYQQLKYTRSFKEYDKKPHAAKSSVAVNRKPGMGIVQINVQQTGRDLPDAIERGWRQFHSEGFAVMYVDLPLCYPASATIVDDLRALGLFYGGVLIEHGGGDVLRMQGLIDAHIAPDAELISSQNGRELLDFVLSDARDVGVI